MQSEDITEEQRNEYLDIIVSESERLANMSANSLLLSKLENQQIFPEKKPYNLSEQLCECMLLFESKFEKKNLNIQLDLDENLIIKADYDLLTHVWSNLFSNAIKFNQVNGKIFLSLSKEGNFAIVKVKDTGCGMTKETCEHIFEKFYQSDTSRSTQGNGLGLALVKRVIDITSGDISVSSTVGVGTTFTVLLTLE